MNRSVIINDGKYCLPHYDLNIKLNCLKKKTIIDLNKKTTSVLSVFLMKPSAFNAIITIHR